jgi:hypothetical protein
MNDTIFPVEDSMLLLLQHGYVKDARFIPGTGHVGFPASEKYLYDWVDGAIVDVIDKA